MERKNGVRKTKHTEKGIMQIQSSLNRFSNILSMVGNASTKSALTNSKQLLKTEEGYAVSWHCRHFPTCTDRFHSSARWSWKAVQTENTSLRCSVRIYETTSAQDLRCDHSHLEWKRKSESAAKLLWAEVQCYSLVIFHNKCERMYELKCWRERKKNLWGHRVISTEKKRK